MSYKALSEYVPARKILVKEKMFDFKDEFEYNQTLNGSYVINEVPENIAKYYPQNYYSFNQNVSKNRFFHLLKRERNRYSFEKKGFIGGLFHFFKPEKVLQSIRDEKIFKKDSKILDVGCGDGRLLSNLYDLGYKNLKGIDPFLKDDLHKAFPVLKKTMYELDEKFDIIILYHVFEHVDQPEKALNQLQKLLNPGGTLIIGIPLADSYAFEKYQENWVQFDAPRHFYLYSSKEISLLAESLQFSVTNVVYNSDEFQFWGSEQYQNGISLFDARSYFKGIKNSIFTTNQIRNFQTQAKKLNFDKRGDQAVFFFKNDLKD